MRPNDSQLNFKRGSKNHFLKFIYNLRFFQLHEWITIAFFSLLGFIGFLLGFIAQSDHILLGHALMEFSPAVTFGAIISLYHRLIFRLQIAGEIDVKLEILTKEVAQELHLFLEKSTEELSEAVVKRLAGTTHIIAKGIVNIFEGLDLTRVLSKCNSTTLFLQRFYFSPKEFELLLGAIRDLIIKHNCTIQILLLSPDQEEIIKDKAKNCLKYEANIDFAVLHIGLFIVSQIKELKRISEQLPADKKDYLQVKLYKGNMPVSITGYEDIIFSGTYLNTDFAEEGFQEMAEGKHTKVYRLWQHHFLNNWQNSDTI